MRASTSAWTPDHRSSTSTTRRCHFKFAGTLRKVEIKLDENKLTANERDELQRLRRERTLANQ